MEKYLNKFYVLWIRIKYQFYKRIYWKLKKPSKPAWFYGWQEVNYSILDPNAVGIGIIMEKEGE